MSAPKIVYISIGSNIGERLLNLQKAIFLLNSEVGSVVNISKVYESPSWGFEGASFLNACLTLQTFLAPEELLHELLRIEATLGRIRSIQEGYTSRSIDLDIIYYEKEIIETDRLRVPHPEVKNRKFVLAPLADIAPQFYHPVLNKDTRNLLQECKDKSNLEKLKTSLFTSEVELFGHLNFIAIEGNIGAGKTTLTNMLTKDYNGKAVLERFSDNPFLPKFYNDQARYAFPLEMSFLADRYQQFTDDTSQLDLFKDFMVSDYDIYKSLIFAQVTLQKDEFRLYRKLFNLMYKEVKKPTLYIYLYQTTERLLENIKKRGRSYEQNIEGEYLNKINKGYFDFFKSHPDQNTLIINVDELDFVANTEDYKSIINQIAGFTLNLNI